jgi:uncharacterized protein
MIACIIFRLSLLQQEQKICLMNTTYLIVPGYGNSNEGHWQTYFQQQLKNAHRIMQQSWDKPNCSDWVNNIHQSVMQHQPNEVVLISHSLGGIAIAHWVKAFNVKIKGAFIVAPPDLENPYMNLGLESFTPIPQNPFPFTSKVIGSTNDYWATVVRTKLFAKNWGSDALFIADAGHINTASGFGPWDAGLQLFREFTARLK